MECTLIIPEAHLKSILCVQYNHQYRYIYTGGEDANIKIWEAESGKLLQTLSEHTGWITSLLFCKELKILFSVSIDGCLIAWAQTGKLLQRIQTGSPIYSLAFNSRRNQILAGFNKKVRVFQFANSEEQNLNSNTNSQNNQKILETRSVACSEHTDVVSCMVSCEGRYYSGGYDKKIVIYDIPHHGDLKLQVSKVIRDAHDAAITCMIFGKDADNSCFDRVVKLWSLDGTLLQRFDGFSDTIVSLSYVLPTQTLWISANSSSPIIYDPRSGINVTDFTCVDEEKFNSQSSTSFWFKQMIYVAETSQVMGLTNKRSLVIWKYNPNAAVTILSGHTDSVECLTFTSKEPVLIFSGADDGVIRKWERLQLNTFMYSQEPLILPKEEQKLSAEDLKLLESKKYNIGNDLPEDRRRIQALRHRKVSEKLDTWKRATMTIDSLVHGKQVELISRHAQSTFRKATSKNIERGVGNSNIDSGLNNKSKFSGKIEKRKSFSESEIDVNCSANNILNNNNENCTYDKFNSCDSKSKNYQSLRKPSVLSLFYYDELDILCCGSEDSRIYVFGYNEEAVRSTASGNANNQQQQTEPKFSSTEENICEKGETNSENIYNHGEGRITGLKNDSVTNRVAGMTIKFCLKEHKDAVTGLFCFFKDGMHWLLSTGWDRRICLWDIKTGQLRDKFRNNSLPATLSNNMHNLTSKLNTPTATSTQKKSNVSSNSYSSNNSNNNTLEELAADDIVLGLDYSMERNEFCYCSADKLAYVRKFSPIASEMTLQVVLQGHEAEVTVVKWNKKNSTWITGSEDRTIRIWPAEGIPCLRVINNDSAITALCIDVLNGCLISGGQDHVIRVYDPAKNDEVVQKNFGHFDEVRSICHLSIRNQYVSGSWDNTVRVWNAYIKTGQRKGIIESTTPLRIGEDDPGFNLNALITPRLNQNFQIAAASEPATVNNANDAFSQNMEQIRLEDELKNTIIEIENVLKPERGRTPKVSTLPPIPSNPIHKL
ncbi:hypothetical protein HK099_008075 [Clydaea vesicula]|uniref:Uncharacterized protein n=1 Tax=Clydaea vesicula TaxID=447962 RepID=A0AAD5Y209_9FUNG|nr:hypothetical protein HK099_008075 [Clydaea vesicula]